MSDTRSAGPPAGVPLRVALVANWYAPFTGGAQIVVGSLARELARRHAVTVLTPRRDPASPAEERADGVRIRRLAAVGSRRWPDRRRKPWVPGILTELLGGRFDVAMAFPSLGPGASTTASAARIGRFRAFLFVFDLLDYSRERLERFPDPRLVAAALHPPGALRRRLRHRRLRAFDGLFALAVTEARALAEVVPFCALLPVCVDRAEFPLPKSEPFEAGRAPRFGCVGRITPHKGQDLALHAFAQARVALEPGATLTIAGAVYDEAFYGELRRLRRELGLERDVEIRRDLPRAELLRVYAECDAHLVPARFLSGGSIVQEAWAAGRPVIQSDRVDPSLIHEGGDGWTFAYPSASELASRMLALVADRDLARRMGSAGRARVERVFHYGRLAEALELAWSRAGSARLTAGDAVAVEKRAWDGDVPGAAPGAPRAPDAAAIEATAGRAGGAPPGHGEWGGRPGTC